MPYYNIRTDIPQPPQEIIDRVLSLVGLSSNIWRHTNYKDAVYDNIANYTLDEVLKDWIDTNIGPFFTEPYLGVVQTIANGLTTHIDHNRTRAFNYLIDCGGDNVQTFWRQEPDDDSPIVEQTVLPVGVWVELDVSKPHGVSGVTGKRIAISVGNTTKINRQAIRAQRNYLKKMISSST